MWPTFFVRGSDHRQAILFRKCIDKESKDSIKYKLAFKTKQQTSPFFKEVNNCSVHPFPLSLPLLCRCEPFLLPHSLYPLPSPSLPRSYLPAPWADKVDISMHKTKHIIDNSTYVFIFVCETKVNLVLKT